MNPYNAVARVQYSLFRKCPKTGWEIAPRALAEHELVLITGGKGTITIEGTLHTLKQGTLLYLYPGLRHSMTSCSEDPMSFYGVHFRYMNAEYFNNQWNCEDCNDALSVKCISEVSAFPKMESLFRRLNKYWNEKALGYEMICRSVLMEILYDIMHSSEINYSSRMKIEKLLNYINKNLGRKITVDELADIVNLSLDYLAVQFKNITGFTIVQYINRCRIDKAKILMINEDMLIKDAAVQVGFSDEFYFSKTFKKYEGMSPGQFLRSIRTTE